MIDMTIDSPDRSQIPLLRALWQEAFGDTDEFLDCFFDTAFDTKRCRCIIEDGIPICVLYWFNCEFRGERVAYIYAVATAKIYRGRGLCTALMKDTHRYLNEHGYAFAMLVPGSETLFGFYGKIGYRLCTRIGELRVSAADEAVEFRKIDADEYAVLRRKFLPVGGVLQENENLKFLEKQIDFFSGNGFLFAANKAHSDTLRCAEFLGDTSKAPAILKTLGYKKGILRIPTGNIPFSMYIPLTDKELVPPSYFGFAFD